MTEPHNSYLKYSRCTRQFIVRFKTTTTVCGAIRSLCGHRPAGKSSGTPPAFCTFTRTEPCTRGLNYMCAFYRPDGLNGVFFKFFGHHSGLVRRFSIHAKKKKPNLGPTNSSCRLWCRGPGDGDVVIQSDRVPPLQHISRPLTPAYRNDCGPTR